MIGRLNHVAIVVPDLAVAAETYRTTLGAKVSAPGLLNAMRREKIQTRAKGVASQIFRRPCPSRSCNRPRIAVLRRDSRTD